MKAGNTLHVTGSDIVAGKNVWGTAKEVKIDSSQTERHREQTHEVKSSGFTLAVKSPVIDAIQNVNQQAQGAGGSQDGRAAALHAIAAAGGMADLVDATGRMTDALNSPGGKVEAKMELSFGSSRSKSTFVEDSTQNNGSSVRAGGTAKFVATGDKSAGQGNVTIQGSNVTAKDVRLEATNKVNLVGSTDADSTRSTNESKSASVGVSYGTGGFGVSASMSRAHGDANSDAATQNNTHINAGNTATIISGGDTNIVGANVNAKKVIADIGGDLNLASVQDTSKSAAHQSSAGGGFNASMGGASASVSMQNGRASGSYAGVNEQSGIQAGAGGFDITVKGNTDLKGAYIGSTATPDRNQLTTGTLTFSDIQNHSEYDASSFGISAGGGAGNGGNNYATHGATSGKNTGGALPLYVSESGSSDASTRSAVSAGSITITDQANQKQDVATLERDTSNLNGSVSRTPDLQQVLSNQSDLINAAQAASEVIAKQIGSYADRKRDEAERNAKGTNDPVLKARYLQEAKDWAEGGDSRAALHVAGGALTGGLTGGGLGAAGGAVGAGVSAKIAPQLSDVAQSIKDAGPTGNANVDELLGNLASNVLAGGVGALVGGGTGALSGGSVERFNRQLHPDEKQKLADLKKGKTAEEQQRLDDAACYRVQCAAQLSDDNPRKADALNSQQRGAGYAQEQQELASTGLFTYGRTDATLDTIGRAWDWGVAGAGRGAANLADQIIATVKASSGLMPPTEPNPLIDAHNGGNPPATGGAVVTPPVVVCGPAGCVVTSPVVAPGAAGYVPSNAILNNGGDDGVQQSASKSSGDAARLTGQEREERVAKIVNGSTSGEKVAIPGMGSTDIDVVAPNGNLIAVGGPAKANNLGKLGQELRIYQAIADQRGVSAQVYFAEGTPRSAINLATKILGEGNVKIFSGSK